MSKLTRGLRQFAWKKSKEFSRKNLYEFINSSAAKVPPTGKCLNVGSGGAIATEIAKFELDVTSIDMDPERKPDLVMDVCDLKLPDNEFDAVFIFEVLEHVPEPHRAVAEILRVLKPGASVYLSTPFVFGIHDEPHDYYRYTHYGLKYLFRHFENVTVTERNSYYEAVCVLMLRLVMVEGDKKSRKWGIRTAVLVAVLAPFVRAISRSIKNKNVTTGYTLEAQKPS